MRATPWNILVVHDGEKFNNPASLVVGDCLGRLLGVHLDIFLTPPESPPKENLGNTVALLDHRPFLPSWTRGALFHYLVHPSAGTSREKARSEALTIQEDILRRLHPVSVTPPIASQLDLEVRESRR
jgi:hypothetical protein